MSTKALILQPAVAKLSGLELWPLNHGKGQISIKAPTLGRGVGKGGGEEISITVFSPNVKHIFHQSPIKSF